MSLSSPYEKGTLKNRFRELATLAGFTLSAAAISVLAMDIIALPLTLFAVKKTGAFNKTIIVLFLLLVLILALYPLVRGVLNLNKNGMSAAGIVLYLVKKTGYHIILFFIFLAISAVVVFVLYFLLYNNHFLLHRALNIP